LASTPPPSDAFLREVDEELRRDQMLSIWKRWGRWLVAGAVGVLAAWGGFLWWQDRETKAAGVEGEQLAKALDQLQAGNDAGATASLKTLSASEREGYKVSATLAQAAMAMGKGDNAAAAKGFASVANDASLSQPWRDLALVRQTAAEFDTLKPETVITRLKPLAAKGNPWFGSAGEMVAVAYLNTGQSGLAGKLFAEIGKDEQVPESIRSRAVQMAGALGVDAVNPAGKE
jgi:hypothetical protein